jgi:hypothetical protein
MRARCRFPVNSYSWKAVESSQRMASREVMQITPAAKVRSEKWPLILQGLHLLSERIHNWQDLKSVNVQAAS